MVFLREGRVMASGGEGELFVGLPDQASPEPAGGGLPRLRFAERNQIAWRPVSLDGLLPDDHRARLVWRFVEALDLTALHATIKAVDGRPGHPPADPRIMLALWLYATVEGIGSAREVARLCEEHIAFQWLCGGVSMNAKTLADFRVDHGAVLERLLVAAVAAADDTGALAEALRPIVDERGSPHGFVPPGTPLLQPTNERRRTGSHYTPRTLTEPLVRHALEPAFTRIGDE